MKVVCPKCGRPVPGEDIDLGGARALCKPCGEILPLPPTGLVAAGPSALVVDTAPQPSDLDWAERRQGHAVQYLVAPPRLASLPLLVFAGIWDSFLVFFYVALVRSPRTPGFALLFPLLHVVAGVWVTRMALIKVLNRSRVTIDRERFRLEHGPVPMRGADVPTSDLDRFEAYESRGNRGGSTWSVRMLTRDGKARKLAMTIDQRDHVTFVVAKLNAALAEVRQPTGYRDAGLA